MQSHEPSSFVIIFAIAAIAPFICEWLPKVRLPLVVLEIGLGILVGPYVLNWAATGPVIQVFAALVLMFLGAAALALGLGDTWADWRNRPRPTP